jgi:hypothetical protein
MKVTVARIRFGTTHADFWWAALCVLLKKNTTEVTGRSRRWCDRRALSESGTKCASNSLYRLAQRVFCSTHARARCKVFFLFWCVALTLLSRTKLCCHVLAAILSVQAISEGWAAFPRTVANPTHHRKAVGKPVHGMNLLGLIMPNYTWADVMAALRTSPKVVRLPGICEPKPSDMKIEHFADGVAPIHGVKPKRKKGGGEQAAAAPAKRAPKKRKVARPADDESGQAADAGDDSSSSQSSSSTPNLPPAPKPRNSDFEKAVAAAAADPSAPRPSRARRPTRKD